VLVRRFGSELLNVLAKLVEQVIEVVRQRMRVLVRVREHLALHQRGELSDLRT